MGFEKEAYQKLYDSIMLREFPVIEKIIVGDIGDWGMRVEIHLRYIEAIDANVHCKLMMFNFKNRIGELNKYMGGPTTCNIVICYDGKEICSDVLNWNWAPWDL